MSKKVRCHNHTKDGVKCTDEAVYFYSGNCIYFARCREHYIEPNLEYVLISIREYHSLNVVSDTMDS